MEKRKWTEDEIIEYRKNKGSIFYYNRDDANFLVPKAFGFGWNLNWANPASWIVALLILGAIIYQFI